MRDKTGDAAVFISHTWGARFRELASAIAYALPPDTLVWIAFFAVRQWPGNEGDIDFRPVMHKTNAAPRAGETGGRQDTGKGRQASGSRHSHGTSTYFWSRSPA
jgi:hypothetical protein